MSAQENNTNTSLPEENQLDDLNRGRRVVSPLTKLGVAGAVVVLVGGVFAWGLWPSKKSDNGQAVQYSTGRPWTPPPIPVHAPRGAAPAGNAPPVPASASTASASLPLAPVLGFFDAPKNTEIDSSANRQGGRDGGPFVTPVSGSDDAKGDNTALGRRLQTTNVGAAEIGKPYNLHFLLKKNETFHCLPDRALTSALPGPVNCTVVDPVWSADGTNVLIERGSTVMGQVQNGLGNGERRLFVVWTDILTLHGYPIHFTGVAGDSLGETGVPGEVNQHIWRQLRAALMLTAVEVGGQVAENLTQRSNNLNFNTGSIQGMGQMALARDLNITPELYRNPAQPLTVTIMQYIPFDRAYTDVAVDK